VQKSASGRGKQKQHPTRDTQASFFICHESLQIRSHKLHSSCLVTFAFIIWSRITFATAMRGVFSSFEYHSQETHPHLLKVPMHVMSNKTHNYHTQSNDRTEHIVKEHILQRIELPNNAQAKLHSEICNSCHTHHRRQEVLNDKAVGCNAIQQFQHERQLIRFNIILLYQQ
jgi:hypothetical protein